MNNNIVIASNIINGVTDTEFESGYEEIFDSIEETHERLENTVISLSTELVRCLCDILKMNEDEDKHIVIEPVYDTYGHGISISWVGSLDEEKQYAFSNVFRNIQILNFMDFYQRFNRNEYIKTSISKFTINFQNKIMDIVDSPLTLDDLFRTDIDKSVLLDIFKTLGIDNRNYELMVSRQQIYQSPNTLADILKNASMFDEKGNQMEFNKKIGQIPIVIDKITFYYPLRKAI